MKTKSSVLPFEQNGAFYHKRACLQMDRSNYLGAANFLRRALECEPGNSEYMLDLADVYARMSCFSESNQILINIIRRGKAAPECFFGMGCNFLAMRQYQNARDAFLSYRKMDPDGEYIEAVEDMLEEIEESEEEYLTSKHMKQADKGKKALDDGDYKLAASLFEEILRHDESLLFVRNNLALAYFCMHKNASAIKEAERVLSEDANNLHALCNIALFYAESGKKDEGLSYIERMLEAHIEDPDDLYKLCLTLLELERDREAAGRLRELLMARPYDKRVLHYYAVCCYNLGNYREALSTWDRVGRIDPDNPVAPYYMQKAREAMEEGNAEKRAHYYYQLPGEELRNRLTEFFGMLNGSREEVSSRFENDPSFRSLARWGVGVTDESFKRATIKLLGFVGGEYAQEILRDFLMEPHESEDLKREAMANLKSMGANEPYIAMLEGAIVEVRVNVLEMDRPLSPAQHSVVQMAAERMPEDIYGENGAVYSDITGELMRIWLKYLNGRGKAGQRIMNPSNWAAALTVCFLETRNINYKRADIMRRFTISSATLSKYVAKIREFMNNNQDGE